MIAGLGSCHWALGRGLGTPLLLASLRGAVWFGAIVLVLPFLHAAEPAALRLPELLSDGMVVQRRQPMPVWGWDRPGQTITVTVTPGTRKATALSAKDGTWTCSLPALEAEGPYTLTVVGSSTRTVADILAGEVWLCAGQSNMHWSLAKSIGGAESIASASDPKLRLLMVPAGHGDEPLADIPVRWNRASPQSARDFSGVAYHFGRALRRKLGVKVGLIQSAVGGSTAEAWADRSWLRSHGEGGARFGIKLYDAVNGPPGLAEYWRDHAGRYRHWAEGLGRADDGPDPRTAGWKGTALDEDGWKDVSLPATFGEAKPATGGAGAMWYRRSVDLPQGLRRQELSLFLGAIQQSDECWWNGQRIGGIGWETPYGPGSFRTYTVPAALAQARNTIAIRVWSSEVPGGFTTEPEWLRVEPRRWTGESVPLAGTWKMRVERSLPALPAGAPARPAHSREYLGPNKTAGQLWDAMIAPCTRLRLAGVAWYQGESNSWLNHHTMFYYDVLPALIRSWRAAFAHEDLPFLIVQLPSKERQDTWPEFRQAQAAALDLPGTGLVVTLDVGDRKEVHCPDKRPVGERLAGLALQQVYAVQPTGRCPLLESAVADGGAVRCSLRDAAGLRVRGGGQVRGLEIADQTGAWKPAQARIEGESLLVRCPGVPAPAGVRYAWRDWPDHPLLENGQGLPLGPFRRHLQQPILSNATLDAQRAGRVELRFVLCDRLQAIPPKDLPAGLDLAGADGIWKPIGNLQVNGSSCFLSSPEVTAPVRVRHRPQGGGGTVLSTADGFAVGAFDAALVPAIRP